MIVTCEKCSTRFELDEARIPMTGAQLRCSKCKHSFFLAHPSAALDESVHAIAEDAAADLSVGTPAPAADLGADAAGAVDEEEEWQFSEEIRTVGDDEGEADAAMDDPSEDSGIFGDGFDESALGEEISTGDSELGSSFSGTADEIAAAQSVLDVNEMSSSGLELGDAPSLDAANLGEAATPDPATTPPAQAAVPNPAAGEAAGGVEAGHDDSSFGSVDDFTSWMEDDDGPKAESIPAARAPSPAAGQGAAEEDPSSWDLTSGAEGGSGTLPSAADSLAAAIEFQQETEPAPTSYQDDLGEPSQWRQALARVGSLAGWLVAIPVVAVAAYFAFQSEWTRWEPASQRFVDGALEAETQDVGWIETSRAGSLLVVNGIAANTGRDVLWLEGLEMTLLDRNGDPVPGTRYSIGSPLPEETLREAPEAKLARAVEMAHKGLLSNPLAPGERRAFQTVIRELPENASRLLLERRR